MPGVILVPQKLPVGETLRRLESLLKQAGASELDGQVIYV